MPPVVYFNQFLGATRTHRLVQKKFQLFSTFFRDFPPEINKKRLKMKKKSVFQYFACSSKLVDMEKLVDSLRGYIKIFFFG